MIVYSSSPANNESDPYSGLTELLTDDPFEIDEEFLQELVDETRTRPPKPGDH